MADKKQKYVIYQVDSHGYIWLMTRNGSYGVLDMHIDNKAVKCTSHLYYGKGSFFDQDFAFAMRDTGEFRIEEVPEKTFKLDIDDTDSIDELVRMDDEAFENEIKKLMIRKWRMICTKRSSCLIQWAVDCCVT